LPVSAQDSSEFRDGRWVRLPRPAKGTAEGELALVRKLAEDGKHSQAVSAAEEFLKKYPDSPQAQEVMLRAGESEIARERYYQAYEWFERQLGLFPAGAFSDRALKRQYEVAEAFLAGKKRVSAKVFRLPAYDEAVEILNRIAEHAPGTAIAEKSIMRIGDFHYGRQQYADAVQAYDNFLKLFPKSAKAKDAMLQAARASYASYRGFEFDDTPLIEAQERFRALAETYPDEASRANVPNILARISDELAHRALEAARFYQRTHNPKAAEFYCRQVVQRYPRSEWAKEAQAALAGMGISQQPAAEAAEAAEAPPVAEAAPSPATQPAPAATSAAGPSAARTRPVQPEEQLLPPLEPEASPASRPAAETSPFAPPAAIEQPSPPAPAVSGETAPAETKPAETKPASTAPAEIPELPVDIMDEVLPDEQEGGPMQ